MTLINDQKIPSDATAVLNDDILIMMAINRCHAESFYVPNSPFLSAHAIHLQKYSYKHVLTSRVENCKG